MRKHRAWGRAKELYGDPLPEIVQKRLDKELGSIIGYGFSTLYIHRAEAGEQVAFGWLPGGQRAAAVGSSLRGLPCAASPRSIPCRRTTVCPHCHKMFRTSTCGSLASAGVRPAGQELRKSAAHKLAKDGFDIPFEVFLGFKGDKVPDIDLNFSGEYQPARPRRTSRSSSARATSSVPAPSPASRKRRPTAMSLKYLEERGIHAGQRRQGAAGARAVVGVKRTTGQHPARHRGAAQGV